MADKPFINSFNLPSETKAPVVATEELKNFLTFPTSAPITLAYQTMGTNTEGIELFAKRKKLINHNAKISITSNNQEIQLNYETGKNIIEVVLPDTTQLNSASHKLFPFLLMEACKRCIKDGELYSETFTFKTSDIISKGVYDTLQSAKKALYQAKDQLRVIGVGQTEVKGTDVQGFGTASLFPTIQLNKKGECYVRINPDIRWDMLTEYWTILPPYFHTLKKRARELLLHIFVTARQSLSENKITQDSKGEKQYTFPIKYRTLQTVLHLPSENTTDETGKIVPIKKANEDIKQPLDLALEEIEQAHRKTYKNTDFQLLPQEKEGARIKEWLDTGSLEVTMKGDFLKPLLDIMGSKTKKISKASKEKTEREKASKEIKYGEVISYTELDQDTLKIEKK